MRLTSGDTHLFIKWFQWKKNATLTFSTDSTTNWSLNDGKIKGRTSGSGIFFTTPYLPCWIWPGLGQFGASLSSFWAHKGLNGSKSYTVGQNITLLYKYWWGPLRAILGNLKAFQPDFRAQSMTYGPVGSLFLTFLATKSVLNYTKWCKVGQSVNILYKWGPLWPVPII